MPRREWFSRKVVLPRWAIGLDFFYRCFLAVGAVVVIVLWWQAATRDEEADRNARLQSCATEYAATAAAHDAEVVALDQRADNLFADLIAAAAADEPIDRDLLARYQEVRDEADGSGDDVYEMARRRIGLAQYSAESVRAGNSFRCPPLPERLRVEPLEP